MERSEALNGHPTGPRYPVAHPHGRAGRVVADHVGDTLRAIYAVHLAGRVCVLHAFQKKSKHGIATPQAEIDLAKRRWKQAIAINEGRA